ncbi:hypothetical protein LXG23DRAFT_33684 [Yarrowia lipolytica]|jgi:hypothetical protein|uniref:Uncharacterized protein n=2 Tax=Yarrowia lipolytica TaxID=4952 RepID=A0A1H6Q7K0_YARLL|nr:hypothetical protein YALI1_E14234g [Yarrowia lipolytica]KAB8283826.1 hypothetical protein BKA91DRAFT_136202 [Yarrowia lipolytica]KAE8172751.1 hypothetical protein BKA90DRAFT_136840 [Yarrowia lipolytica]KAJ8056799.1 hypothetical protein LXG23DRAFT_33684 [Yarrowia lipolytica]QNP98916.1 Universal stress protein A family protein [Yarrowia lipolytica]
MYKTRAAFDTISPPQLAPDGPELLSDIDYRSLDLPFYSLAAKHPGVKLSYHARTVLFSYTGKQQADNALKWLMDELIEDNDELVCLKIIDKHSAKDVEKYHKQAADILRAVVAEADKVGKKLTIDVELGQGSVSKVVKHCTYLYQPALAVVARTNYIDPRVSEMPKDTATNYLLRSSVVPVIVVRPPMIDKWQERKKAHANDQPPFTVPWLIHDPRITVPKDYETQQGLLENPSFKLDDLKLLQHYQIDYKKQPTGTSLQVPSTAPNRRMSSNASQSPSNMRTPAPETLSAPTSPAQMRTNSVGGGGLPHPMYKADGFLQLPPDSSALKKQQQRRKSTLLLDDEPPKPPPTPADRYDENALDDSSPERDNSGSQPPSSRTISIVHPEKPERSRSRGKDNLRPSLSLTRTLSSSSMSSDSSKSSHKWGLGWLKGKSSKKKKGGSSGNSLKPSVTN